MMEFEFVQYLALGLFVLSVFALLFVIYDKIKYEFADKSPKTHIKKERRADDIRYLINQLGKGKTGEPLLFLDGNQVYTASNEKRGLVVGVSGTGKTNYILAQIAEWSKSGKSYVVTDIKPEIFGVLHANSVLQNYGYDAIVINPTDPNSTKYNLLDDIDDNDLGEVVKILVPAVGDTAGFALTAQKILKGLILHLKSENGSVSLPAVYDFVNEHKRTDKLFERIIEAGDDDASKLIKQARLAGDNERFMSSSINTLLSSLEFLDDPTIHHNMSSSDISLKDALKQPKTAVFLQFDQLYQSATATLYSATVTHIIRLLMSNYRERDEVFLLFDELLNGGRLDMLTAKMNTMRSYKLPTFIYIQSLAGLYEKYGEMAGKNLMSSCDIKVCYRVNDNASAREFSELAGDVVATITHENWEDFKRNDGSTIKKKKLSSGGEKYVRLVTDAELKQMPKGKVLMIIDGVSAVVDIPQHWTHLNLTERADGVRPSDFINYNNQEDAI